MSHKDLTDALEIVRRELSQSDQLDAEDVAKLRATMLEIESALEHRTQIAPQLSQNVSHSALSFEESHPRLTETLGRIADMLQQMGI